LKRRARNRAVKTRIKNVVKDVREAVKKGNREEAHAALHDATSALDKAASKGVIHWRTAGRKISRLNRAVNKLS
jgi:small subunit ribosomal protein S20